MRIAIFQGPPCQKPRGKVGPERHFMLMRFASNGEVRTASFIGTDVRIAAMVAAFSASFWTMGTWELTHDYSAGFPAPRPDVLAWIKGELQMELAA